MKVKFIRRVVAYIIDIAILGLVVGLSLMLFSNGNESNLKVLKGEVNEINQSVLDKSITTKNYVYRYADLNYQIDKMEVIDNVLNAIYIIILFIYIPFLLKGTTLGMKIMKIKVVKENGDNASLNDYLFRSVLIYSLGYLFITLGAVYFLPSFSYFMLSSFLLILMFLLVIISSFMILYRHDQKGLHDILTKTKVIKI